MIEEFGTDSLQRPESFLRCDQTSYLIYQLIYLMSDWGSFPGGKSPECNSGHITPSSVEVRNGWSYASTPPNSSQCGWYLIKQRDSFTFMLPSYSIYSLVSQVISSAQISQLNLCIYL